MHKNKIRLAAAATALAVVGAASSIGGAGAAVAGVATGKASTTVVGVELGTNGQLLSVRLLGDDARATTDPATAAAPEAFSRLAALGVSSSVAGLSKTVPDTLEARMPGGSPQVSSASVNLGAALPASVATGTLNLAHLTAAVDTAGARAGMTASVSNLGLAGGLLSVKGASSNLLSNAASAVGDASRSVKVDAVAVLDLGALLNGLGINLASLLPSQVSGLLTQLQATVPGVGDGAALQAVVDSVQSQITALTNQVNAGLGLAAGQTVNTIVDTVGLGGIVSPTTVTTITNITDPVAQANALIDQLQASLAGLLANALTVLDGLVLLQANGIEVGVATKAADTVANSAADIVGRIGNVQVGNITLPGVDLAAAAATVNGVVSGINDKLRTTLGAVSPDLADMVNVAVLKQTKSVSSDGKYVHSLANITGLEATIKPPANLAALVGTILGQTAAGTSVGALITQAGSALPALNTLMTTLNSTLTGAVSALAGGATLRVASVSSASDFAAIAAGGPVTPGQELPRTGSPGHLQLLALGVLLVALGLGFRNWIVMPLPRR